MEWLYKDDELATSRVEFEGTTSDLIIKAIEEKLQNPSKKLREEFPLLQKLPSLWTRSYFVSSAGNASAETIKKYIQNQTTH